jgi:glycosyltransferase involved in cell wall biosynthesis
MTTPKVSVLVPTYNYARYLPEAIESVLAQDLRDFEMLISDDGSTDDSAEVIARYAAKDRRIRFHVHPVNLGMVQNWNWCLSEARGEFVKFVFGDDMLASPQALTKLLELLESSASAVLAASARYVVDENSEVIAIWDDFGRPGAHSGTDVIAACLNEDRNLIGEPSVVLFRRRDAIRGFNPRFRQIVDQEMWFHLLEKGEFAFTSEPLCCFRKHATQQTEVNAVSQIGVLEAMRLFAEHYSKPYLQSKGFRKRGFDRIYQLRKRRKANPQVTEEMLAIEHELSAKMTASWYAAHWLRRRLTRPFQNLGRWIERQRHRSAPVLSLHKASPQRQAATRRLRQQRPTKIEY